MEKFNSKKSDIRINLNGDVDIDNSVKAVSNFVNDLDNVIVCIPGIKNFNEIGAENFTADLSANISLLNLYFNIEGSLLKYDDRNLSVLLRGSNKNSEIKINLNLNLKGDDKKTRMFWDAEYELNGFVNILGKDMIEKISYAKIEQTIINIKKNIEAKNK